MSGRYRRHIVNILVYVVGLLLICLLLPKLIVFFMPFVVGWIISLVANPLVRLLEKRLKIRRKHSTAVIIVAVLALVVLALYGIGSAAAKMISSFIAELPELYKLLVQELTSTGENLQGLSAFLSPDLVKTLSETVTSLTDSLGSVISTLGTPTLAAVGTIASNIPNILVMSIFTILWAYFIIADREQLVAMVHKYIPESARAHWHYILDMFKRAIGGYFKAQVKIMAVVAAILLVGFWLLHIRYAILWAILIAFLDFLPFLGTGTVLGPWAIIKIVNGQYTFAIWLVVLYVICLLVHQLLQPKLVGDSVGLNPMSTLFFMFVGYKVSGVFGMIVAIPVGMIIIGLYRAGAFDEIITDVRELAEGINRCRKGEE